MARWKEKLFMLAGCLCLMNFILTVILTIYWNWMHVPCVPSWVIQEVDGLSWAFLWRGQPQCLGGYCFANWQRIYKPKKYGWQGVINITCCCWNSGGTISLLIDHYYYNGNFHRLHLKFTINSISYFWNDIFKPWLLCLQALALMH